MDSLPPISDFIDFPARDEILARLRGLDDAAAHFEPLFESIADRLGARTYERSASAFVLIEMMYDHEENHGGDVSYLLPRCILTLTGDRDLALSALSAFNEIKDALNIQGMGSKRKQELGSAAGGEEASNGGGETAEVAQLAVSEPGEDTAPLETAEIRRQELAPSDSSGPAVAGGDRDSITREVASPTPFESAAPSPPSAALVAETGVTMGKLQNAQKAVVDLGLSARVSIDLVTRRPTRERVSRTLQDVSALRTALRRFEELLSEAEVEVLEIAGVLWEDQD